MPKRTTKSHFKPSFAPARLALGSISNEIQQPRPYDLVGNPVLVGGIGTGFEAVLQYRIHEGHDERTGSFNVGGGTGEHGQFQLAVDVSGAAFQLDRLFVEVYEDSAEDGSEINKVIVPVIYGPGIVPGYIGYRIHVVQPGDTLSAIAETNYGDAGQFSRIVRANPLIITDPDLIFPGQLLKVPIGA
ncbi:MAG: Gmad2 immunoglobulin-like domain-containing protein [Longimicrobiales bacterium]